MKTTYTFLSLLIICLPLLCVWLMWDHLPLRLLLDSGQDGKPDRLASRQEWLLMLLSVLFVLTLIRSVLLALLNKYLGEQDSRFLRIHFLSAAFVGCMLGLLILRTVYQATDFLPVLMAIFGSAGVYIMASTGQAVDDQTIKQTHLSQHKVTLGQLHTLSHLVIVRVNLLAALLMIFARSGDRWTIGILANLLAFAALSVIEVFRRSSA